MDSYISDYMFDMAEIGDLAGNFADATIATVLYSIFWGLVSIFFLIVSIAFIGAVLTRISHKLKVFEKETLAYIPFVRDFYRMRMVGIHPAFALLYDVNGYVLSVIAALIVLAIFKSLIVAMLVFIAGYVATAFYTYKYYNKFLKLFGFDGTLALVTFIPVFSFIFNIIEMIVAFSDKFEANKAVEQRINNIDQRVMKLENGNGKNVSATGNASITGINGKYAGSRFEINNGETVVIGRDIQKCNIVYDEKYASISRVHCAIRYAANENAFYVTDYSSNGTLVNRELNIGKNATKKVEKGSVIYLGDENNAFRLG